jgi:ankyrin repeat protein
MAKLLKADTLKNESLLHLAIKLNKTAAVQKIIEAKLCDINQPYPFNNYTPLHLAVHNNNADLVRVLLENGADTTCVDSNNLTALALAKKKNLTLIDAFHGFKKLDEQQDQSITPPLISKIDIPNTDDSLLVNAALKIVPNNDSVGTIELLKKELTDINNYINQYEKIRDSNQNGLYAFFSNIFSEHNYKDKKHGINLLRQWVNGEEVSITQFDLKVLNSGRLGLVFNSIKNTTWYVENKDRLKVELKPTNEDIKHYGRKIL